MGVEARSESIPNPRKESEEHYYNPKSTGLLELGLEPTYMTDEVLAEMMQPIIDNADRIVADRIMPRVKWN